jgi:hypothetical protein
VCGVQKVMSDKKCEREGGERERKSGEGGEGEEARDGEGEGSGEGEGEGEGEISIATKSKLLISLAGTPCSQFISFLLVELCAPQFFPGVVTEQVDTDTRIF